MPCAVPSSLSDLTKTPKLGVRKTGSSSVLFIDAGRLGIAENRTHNLLTEDDVAKISTTFRAWRSKDHESAYSDQPGFCKEVDLETIKSSYSLFPAAYIDARADLTQAVDAGEVLPKLRARLEADFGEGKARRAELLKILGAAGTPNSFYSGRLEKFQLRDFLTLSEERLEDREEPEILTCTEGAGLILQRERFAKRVATEDTSNYKVVRYTDIVYNPYLLWGGAIDQCTVVKFGITSPAYAVFRVNEQFDVFLIGRALRTAAMIHRYDGISVGTVQRRRRAPPEKFLTLEIRLPPVEEQVRFADASRLLFAEVVASRDMSRSIEEALRIVGHRYSE